MRERTDDDLVAAANAGDESAFEALYFRYRDWVVSRAWRITGNGEDALDVLQETFLYLFGKFPGFELRARMTTFLYPAVRNLSLERLRKRGRTVPLDGEAGDVEPPEPPARDTRDIGAERRELAETVRGLPAAEREIVILRFCDEMSLQEIAQALGCPLGTVKSRLHSALSRLRRRLER